MNPSRRFVDFAVQFEAYDLGPDGLERKTGSRSPVYGGRYDIWAGCYVAEAESVHTLKVSEPQLELVVADEMKVEASGGRGGGKSEGGVARCLRFICERPGERGRVISPIQDLTEVVRAKLLKSTPLHWIAPHGIVLSKPPKLRFVNGVEVEFRTSKTPDSLRSWGGSWTLVDEAQDVSTYAIDIAWPCLRETPEPRMWFTLTPKTGEAFRRHLAYERSSTARCIGFSSYDNPFAHREVHDESAKDESVGGMSKETYSIEIEADWSTIARMEEEQGLKAVFPCFDREKHTWRGQFTPGLQHPVDITAAFIKKRVSYGTGYKFEYVCGVDPNGARPNYATVWKIYRPRTPGSATIWRGIAVVPGKGHCGHLGKILTQHGYTRYNTLVVMDASGDYNRLHFREASAAKMREEGYMVLYPSRNPRVKKSIDDVMAKLDPVHGEPTMYLDMPACDLLAKQFETVVYNKAGSDFDRSVEPDVVDSARYPVSYFEPAARVAPLRGIL